MIKTMFLFFGLFLLANNLDAQIVINENTSTEEKKDSSEVNNPKTKFIGEDKVYLHNGKTMQVKVKRVYLNELYYIESNDGVVKKMNKKLVHKIEYKSGKLEIVSARASNVRKVGDYRKIKVTKKKKDVEGLVEVIKVKAVAEGSPRRNSTPKSLERRAIIVLRKKAALLNANIILITDKKVHVAFGETPSVTLKGIAYSYR